MRSSSSLLAVLSLAAVAFAGGPEEFLAAAIADAKRRPEELRQHDRYLVRPPLLGGQAQEKRWVEFKNTGKFHVRSLSRDFDLDVLPVPVGDDLVRINLLDHEWPRELWEKLVIEPYFHVRLNGVAVKVEKAAVAPLLGGKVLVERGGLLVEVERGQVRQGEDVFLRTGSGGSLVRQKLPAAAPAKPTEAARGEFAHGPLLPAKLITELGLLLNSDVPIVRYDEWVERTGGQFKRQGTGYYDWLGFKTRDDIEKFCGLDKAAARRSRKEAGAVIAQNDNGPAPNNRQILAEATLNGWFWRTLDVDANEGRKNAIINLDGTLDHGAEEIVGPRPDGLQVFGASDNKGNLQEKVPVQFATDNVHFGNRVEIEPMYSCVVCHAKGLPEIDDWMRKTFRGVLELAGKDYKETKRLKQIYLSDLDDKLKVSIAEYAKALKKVNGWTPEENAAAYKREKVRYAFTPLNLAETAAELYSDEKGWRTALLLYNRQNKGKGNPLLLALLEGGKVRREHWVEFQSLAQEILLRSRP